MSVLLRIATLSDHQFIQHHLLRCPPGVSEWGVAYLQVTSPLYTGRVLEAQFGQRGTHVYMYMYEQSLQEMLRKARQQRQTTERQSNTTQLA